MIILEPEVEHADKIGSTIEGRPSFNINSLNYAQTVLETLIKSGDFTALNELVVYQDGKTEIKFSADSWEFAASEMKQKAVSNITFSLSEKNVSSIAGLKSERHFINQMKCYALAVIRISTEVISLSSLHSRLHGIRKIARLALRSGLQGLECITEEHMLDWIADGVDFSQDMAFVGINSVKSYGYYMPFKMVLPVCDHKLLKIDKAEVTGKIVMPFRIWSTLINTLSEQVDNAYKNRDEIHKVTEQLVENGFKSQSEAISRVRQGATDFHPHTKKSNSKSYSGFIKALKDEGIPLVDYEENDRWLELYYKYTPTLNYGSIRQQGFEFLGEKLTIGQLNQVLIQYWNTCSWLCMLLSGMRLDELYAMHPEFGAQKVQIPVGRSTSKSETIYVLTTRQSKISMNSQKLNDVYVTTVDGYKAFKVMHALSKAALSHIEGNRADTMFINTKAVLPSLRKKGAVHAALNRNVNNIEWLDLTLTQKDIDNLSVSEGAHRYSVGDKLILTTHLARRSLAYYLIGYELCSLPALKQQLGHFSMAMTRWYARNATKYSEFWKIVEDERVSQKADICVQIFERLSNGERLAGGKGAAYLRQVENNPNFFEEGVNRQLLSKRYWEEMLRNGGQHLHAIAVGMYCTNTKCSMRLAIDLTECVDCEYDYIENVAYAEGARMNSMHQIERLMAEGELNASSASKCYMTILACERIMNDLDFKFEPYKVHEEVKNMVIDFRGGS